MNKTPSSHILSILLLGAAFTLHAQTTETKPKAKKPAFVIPADINGLKRIVATRA